MLNALDLAPPRLIHLTEPADPASVERAVSAFCRLIENNCGRGARIAIIAGNSPLFVAALLSVMSLGRCAVLLNPALTAAELARAVSVSGAGLLLADENCAADAMLAASELRIVGEAGIAGHGALRALGRDSGVTAAGSEFIVQFTSGVSGVPLAAMRSYDQARNEIDAYIPAAALCSDDIVLCAVPMFHSFGLFAGLLSSLRTGARLAIMPSFSPADVVRVSDALRPTVFLGVPLFYEILNRTGIARRESFSSYRLLLSAGGPLAADTASAFGEKFGKTISQLYGATETGVIAMNGPGVGAPASSVGRPLKGRTIRILDEDGKDAVQGEIALLSPATAAGYLGEPEQSARKFRDGWYLTGDIGQLDTSGCLAITGRKSTFINVGGLKVDPGEIESAILASGEVLECAVVGVPRPQFGETIRAHVVLKPGGNIERIRAHCRARLAGFKLPREFQPVASLPRSATGKVLRKYLLD